MATTIGRELQRNTHGDSCEVTLPCIWGRLSKLETVGFSYNELLHDFGSRRHRSMGPVKERPVTCIVDPAQETDEMVQAYLALTRERWNNTSSRDARSPLAQRGSAAVKVCYKRPQPEKQPGDFGTLKTQQAIKDYFERPARDKKRWESAVEGSTIPIAQNFELQKNSIRHLFARSPTGLVGCHSSIGELELRVPRKVQSSAIESPLIPTSTPDNRRKISSPLNLHSSVKSPLGHKSFNYYPQHNISADTVVSLISPRTSKKIQRLPIPGQSERETLQQVERALRTFPRQVLGRNEHDGLYSTLGRGDAGLIETDIDNLTATVTGRTHVLASAKRAVLANSLAKHSGGVFARLLGSKEMETLPTLRPQGMGEEVSRTFAPNSIPSTVQRRYRDGRRNIRQGKTVELDEAVSGMVLNVKEHVRRFRPNEQEYRNYLSSNLRRLRTLLGETFHGEAGRLGSPSLLSVTELRALGVSKKRQHSTWTNSSPTKAEKLELEKDRVQSGVEGELSMSGNRLLRNLAIALLSSVQCRIQKDLLLQSFRRWQEMLAKDDLSRYLEATLLVQSTLRRILATLEASERRRLRDNQTRREVDTVALAVQRRQELALKLQKWIRGRSGRRRAFEKRRLWQAAQVVQRTTREKAARSLGYKRREEKLRCQEAAATIQQQEKEIRDNFLVKLTRTVEEFGESEALLKQRCHELQQRFRREGAAIRIQTVWRASVLKRNLSAFVRIAKRTRLIRTQRIARGFLARRELQRRRMAFQLRFACEFASAIKIQSLGRKGIAWNEVDARRFERNKDNLVSTLDAERALRDCKREVPLIKALAAREGLLAAEGKGMPYIIDIVAFKVLMADKRRLLNPWQGSTDTKAATKIQALWRGYRQAVRVRRMRVRQRREKAKLYRAIKLKAVNNIQRLFRGERARLEARSRRFGLRAVKVQKVWRGFLGKRVSADRRQSIQAAILLQRRLRGAQARSLAARLRREAITTSAPASKIQATSRRYLAKRLQRKLMTERQIEWEWGIMAKEMTRFCAERARLSKLAVKRSGEEGSGSFRLEGRTFTKLFTVTPGVFSSSFRATDADLIFARVKDKEEKTLRYAQFASALNIVGATLFPETKRFRDFNSFKAKAARLLELIEGKVLRAPGATEYRLFCQKSGERYLNRSTGKMQAVMRGHLGRKRTERKRLERTKEARSTLEAAGAVKIQALARRYSARCRAIRLAQVCIFKYIDPTTHLPYWVHLKTGITSWKKPKVFRADDVEHAMMVATSKTEHLVKCSICDDRPVKRLCTSCRDSYCDECFQALHGKGHRREHVAPVIHMCCVCHYQHSSRLCESCTFKANSTCAYCDVCFFNRHAGLDTLITPNNGGAKKWGLMATNLKPGWNHKWMPLVVTCVECRRYAARWLCDDCEEVYCVGCYASVHMHGIKVYHGAEKLPYYPIYFHMEYAMACRKRSRTKREEEAHITWLKEKNLAKQRATTKIQARWRGRVGRIAGQTFLKAGRATQREAWRQRKRDDRMRKAIWYATLDLAGLAPELKSDRLDEKALREIPRMARARPRKYITLNRDDDAWVPGKLEKRKGTVKRGFDVGEMNELKDQAKKGGIRLPGRHSVKTGHRCVYTDPVYNMKDFLKPKNVIRVQRELFKVEAILQDRIGVDRVWHRPDAESLLLYKMVLSTRQKLGLTASRVFWTSQAVQYGIQVALILGDFTNGLLRKAAMRYKKKRLKRLYALTKNTLKGHEERIRSLKLKLNIAQLGLDRPAETEVKEKAAGAVIHTAQSDDAPAEWVETFDPKTGTRMWRNVATGEMNSTAPLAFEEKQKMKDDLAKQKEMLRAKKASRKR